MPPRRSRSITRSCRSSLHSEDALQPGAPRCGTKSPDNMLVDTQFGDSAATDARLRARPTMSSTTEFHIGRVTGVPMEPRAALADYDAATGRYTLYAGSGGAVRQKSELAQRARHRARQAARAVATTSAAISARATASIVEFGLVLWAARKLGRPVKYHRDALGSLPQRLPGPRSRHQGRAGARRRRQLPRDARRQYQQCRRALRVAVAAQQGLRADHRLLRHSGRRRCARSRSSPTPCRPRPIAAPAGRR